MVLVAMLLAATVPQQPSVGISAGPVFVRESGRAGVGSGPLLRVDVGYPVGEYLAAEIWMETAIERAPMSSPGDRGLIAGGGGARLLVTRFGTDGKLGLWMHGGAGWGLSIDGDGKHGPVGFGGALFTMKPFVKRFTVGLEADAVAWRNSIGLAVLPSLRCAF